MSWMDDPGDENDFHVPQKGDPAEPDGRVLSIRASVKPLADDLAKRRQQTRRTMRFTDPDPKDAA